MFSRINDVCPFDGIKNVTNVVKNDGVVVVVDAGQAYHVDVESEKVLASIVTNLREQPGSPEKDFSAGILGIYADFKRSHFHPIIIIIPHAV